MKPRVPAQLHWIKISEGGRTPPTGSRYSTVAKFDVQGEAWRENAWSLVVEFPVSPDFNVPQEVRVSFLADGPSELLVPGSRFELVEGTKVVAKGTILDDR
jgi:hypothetical protein